MPRKQMNIRLDELTRETVKRIAERWNMSESQVITRGVVLLDQELKKNEQPEHHDPAEVARYARERKPAHRPAKVD